MPTSTESHTVRHRLVSAACVTLLGVAAASVVIAANPGRAGAIRATAAVSSAASYARNSGYVVGVSVLDTSTGRLYSAGAHTSTFASESVVKVFIATRLILAGRMHGTTATRAYKMITQSDDAIATSFYGSVGGDGLINWIKQHYRVPSLGSPPHRAGYWGNTHITSDGLVRLYAKVKADRRVAPWLLNAMHHATRYGSDGTYQFFGLPSATTQPAIKQGWGTDYDDGSRSADFNTTGYVNGNRYAVAILARGPIRNYGSRIGAMLTHAARLLLPGGTFPDPPPSIRSLSAHSGRTAGGTHVRIYGRNFTHVTGVYFGGYRAVGTTVLDRGRIAVTTPRHAAGRVLVRVKTTHGFSSTAGPFFTFVAPPVVTASGPASGPVAGGTAVTVRGAHFNHIRQVLFGAAVGRSLRVVSSTTLRVVAPPHAAATVPIRVRTGYGLSAAGTHVFTYLDPAPTVTSVVPNSGPAAGGTTVTVNGTGFTSGSTVQFATTAAATVTFVSTTQLRVVTPAHASGLVDVRVTSPRGTSPIRAADGYTFNP